MLDQVIGFPVVGDAMALTWRHRTGVCDTKKDHNISQKVNGLCFIVVWYQSILPISFMIASLALGNFYVLPISQQMNTRNSVCADFITCAVYWQPCLSSCIEECRYGRIHNTCLMICMLVVTKYFQLYNTHTQVVHIVWQPLVGLLSWYPAMGSSLCYSSDDQSPEYGFWGVMEQ